MTTKPKSNQGQTWAVHFHPRDRNSHSGYTQYFVGDHKAALAWGKERAGSAYTVTVKPSSFTKPYTPTRTHSRPA